MDGALSSSRYGQADRGEGSSREHHRHDRRDRRRHHPYGGRERGGGGGYNHRDNRGRGGRPRQSKAPGNRFGGASTTSVNPQTAMLRQLGALLGKVGDVQDPPEGSTIVESINKNISDLALVLCSKDNAPKFLKFESSTGPMVRTDIDMEAAAPGAPMLKAEEEAGALAHLLISTVSTLPLQTPSYAGLTLAVNELSPKPDFTGFAGRCVTYGMWQFSSDVDSLLLEGLSEEQRSHTMSRLVHVLRYLALLGRLTIVLGYEDDDMTATARSQELTLAGLLHTLTTASIKAATSLNQLPTACLLANLVLSTLPYVQGTISKEFVTEQLLEPLETNVLNPETYKSTFAPGVGCKALLLKEEQDEGDDEDEEDDEEDESGQRCDTLQDLLRSVKRLVQSEEKATQFTLFTDAPWVGLKAPPLAQLSQDGDVPPGAPMTYTGEALRLSLSKSCISIPLLLSESDDGSLQLQCIDLSGIVFGRLPIFGSPPEDDDDEDEEANDDMETAKNEQLLAYQKGFGLLDRYFLADAIRDLLISHQSHVSDAGLERGSAKEVAQQLWAISHLYTEKGVEYGIIEALLSLIMQANNEGAYRNLFVSRVLLELTRLQPSVMPQALALAVSNIVSYYLPALVPTARDNFSRWFSFHLSNTDYQWPSGYWEHWAEYVTNGKRNSRGDFTVRTLSLMASRLSNVRSLVTDCLPHGSVLANYLLVKDMDEALREDDAILSIVRELEARIWEKNEDPDSLRAYMVGGELSETMEGAHFGAESTDMDKNWWRTGLTVRALLQPATRQHVQQREALQRALQPAEDNAIEQDGYDAEDVLMMLAENLVRYRPMLVATLARDAQSNKENADLRGETKASADEQLAIGGVYLLKQLENVLRYSRVLLESCTTCLVENQIVSGEAVMRWTLGDAGDDNGAISLVERWWEFANVAIRIGINDALAGLDSQNEESGGMVIDHGYAEETCPSSESIASRRMNAIVQRNGLIMQYMAKRVCGLLHQSDEGKKKLTPDMVDMVEGLKHCVVATKTLVLSKLKEDTSSTEKECCDLWSKSSMCGSELASLCVGAHDGSCFAVNTLIASLQAM